jgi:hypothetical protein
LTSQIGRDAVLSESYGRGYWYSAKCLLNLGVLPSMIGPKPARRWSEVCSTQGRFSTQAWLCPPPEQCPLPDHSQTTARPQPLQTPPVRGIGPTRPDLARLGPMTDRPTTPAPPVHTRTTALRTTHHTTHPSTYTPRGNSPGPCTLRGPKTNQRTKVKPQ